MKPRELLKKIELKLRPLQLGEGQPALDDADGLADDDRAGATDGPASPWLEQDKEPDR